MNSQDTPTERAAQDEREIEAQRLEQAFIDAGGEREFTPHFGDTLRGIWASECNPIRDGLYVQTIRRARGRVNPGTFYQLTDGKGKLWEFPAKNTVLIRRASRAQEGFATLYRTVNAMMVYLGAHGSISARGDHASAVMDALHAIDVALPAAPEQPTPEMIAAGKRALYEASHRDFDATDAEMRAAWLAMQQAAPKEPE